LTRKNGFGTQIISATFLYIKIASMIGEIMMVSKISEVILKVNLSPLSHTHDGALYRLIMLS